MKEFENLMKNVNIVPKVGIDNIINQSLARCSWETKTMVIMEELSELTVALSKINRLVVESDKELSIKEIHNSHEYWNLIEEMADVRICLMMLKKHFEIPDAVETAGMHIKLARELERCRESL